MTSIEATLDRVAGVLVGLAAGDALGAGYEFSTPPTGPADMIGGGLGPFEPGEWTDDTQMTLCVAEVAASSTLDAAAVGERFLEWYRSRPKDVGVQTATVLSAARTGADLPALAAEHFARNPKSSAGNGSLMRTAPVAIAHLGDDEAIVASARAISALTHADPLATDACVLWCIAIDRAVRESRLDGVHDGLRFVDDKWQRLIGDAETMPPETFTPNGFVVLALQAAYASVVQTPASGPSHLEQVLQAAVHIGDDADTVAAIAGALAGGRWGASAVPERWRGMLHGWPGYDVNDLVRLAEESVRS